MPSPPLIRVLLVDDHAMLREALAERLQREPSLQVVAAADNADEAVQLALKLNPDVVVMDIDMPGQICFDAARTIASMRPATRIMFLSAYCNDHYIAAALSVDAAGYVIKREPPPVIVQAIRTAAEGGIYYSDEVRARLIVDGRGVRLTQQAETRAATLSLRELEVLRYIARGMSKKAIAQTMHLSVKTVENHTAKLMVKLDIHDRVELTRFAIREGLADA